MCERRSVTVVFPHQLFSEHPAVSLDRAVYLIEDSLFFGDTRFPVRFHAHKLVLHVASMDAYAEALERRGITVRRVRYDPQRTVVDEITVLAESGVRELHICDVTDDVLRRRIERTASARQLTIRWYETPMFLSPLKWLHERFAETETPRMQTFYVAQRRRLGILVDRDRPIGGRWSFDAENRKSWPARTPPPPEPAVRRNRFVDAAVARVRSEFPNNPGDPETFWYPVTADDAASLFDQFLEERLASFGPYEDAICADGTVLYHSLLTPSLNIGLITPERVLTRLAEVARLDNSCDADALPSVEGFVRQIIGWREFIRGVYLIHGVRQRNANYWGHTNPMPTQFYTARTGLVPLDRVIERVIDRSYCHHIERLMVIGNAMLLCEIDPNEVYRWFMEFFVDAFDWVMVPNVYGMSQFADGGLMASKPYISGANYVRKMSDFPGGAWEKQWTALFWRFLARHREFFGRQPRLSMLVKQLDRDQTRAEQNRAIAERFLTELHSAG